MFSECLKALTRKNLQYFSTPNQKKLVEFAGLGVIGQGRKDRGRRMGHLKISLF